MTRTPWSAQLIRWWVVRYTRHLPEDTANCRRREIESDLWESAHDPHARHSDLSMLVRLLRGIPDDLRWRNAMARESPHAYRRSLAVALALVGAVLWFVALRTDIGSLPDVPPLARFDAREAIGPTPPPPPPPPPLQSR